MTVSTQPNIFSFMFAFAGRKIRQVVLVIWCQYPREGSSHLHNGLLNCRCFVVQLCKFWHCTKPLLCAAHWKVLVSRCQYPREGSSHLHNELSSTAIPGLPMLCSTVSATTLYCTKWTFWHCTKAFVMWHEVSFSPPAHLYNQLLLWGSSAQQVFTIMETAQRSTAQIVHNGDHLSTTQIVHTWDLNAQQ